MTALTLLVVAAAQAGSLKDLDKSNGFRDVIFTEHCGSVSGRAEDADPLPGLHSYHRKSDVQRVGPAQLQDITYRCYDSAFAEVVLHAYGQENARHLLDTLRNAYGAPVQVDPKSGDYGWVGKKVVLQLSSGPWTDDVTVVFSSVEMTERMAKDAVDDAVNDLAQ